MTTHHVESRFDGPEPEMLIDDLATFQMLSHPVRTAILQLILSRRLSVREMADELGVPVTRLYYHVNMLEEAGLIRVVATQKAGAMIQRLYQASAQTYRPSSALVESVDDPREAARVATAVMLDPARFDLERSLTQRFTDPAGPLPKVSLGRTITALSPERADAFVERLLALVEEFEELTGDGTVMSFTYAFCPVAGIPGGDGVDD